jgi:uncharacterized protein YceK
MRRRATACLAAVLAFGLGGCGTIVNLNGSPGKEIYGGVKQDALSGSDHFVEAFSSSCPTFSPVPEKQSLGKKVMIKSFCAGCGVCMWFVDLPISAVADTVTLPVTVTAALTKKPDKRPHKRPTNAARNNAGPMPATAP